MLSRSTGFLLAFLLAAFLQSPRDSIRQHYEAAESYRRSGNLVAAENEFKAILAEAYPNLGRIYIAQENYKAAVETLELSAANPSSPANPANPSSPPNAVNPSSPSNALLTDLAIAYFYAGKYQQAIEPLTKVLARDARSMAAHQMLGKTYFMMGEFEKASRELETALRLAPNDFDVEYTLALAYLKQKKPVEARRIYGATLKRMGERPLLHMLMGHAYRETGYLSEAIEELKKAATLDPQLPRVHYYLGLTYLLKDGSAKLVDAAKEMQFELAAHPDEFLANYYLGLIRVSEGKWQDAVVPLEKASQVQTSNPDPYFLLGQAYQSLGNYQKAIDAFRSAIKFNPRLDHNDYQVTNAHYRLGQSLLKIGRTEEGQKELQMAADLKAKAFNSDREKLDAYLAAGNKREQDTFKELTVKGVAAETNAIDQQKQETLKADAAYFEKVIAAAHNNIGMLRAERQDFRAAVDHFRLALKWNPQQEGLNFNLGLASYKAEAYKQAIASLESELQSNPANTAAKQFLGLSYFSIETYQRAAELLTEVVAAKPNDAALYYPLAVSLGMQGKKEQADNVIRQMIALGGNSPQIHILLGRAYYGKNDSAKALEELKTAIALDNKVLLAHFYSGLIYIKTGKLDEAAKEFEAELALNPGDIEAKYHLAYVALARQETARGISLMREVIRDKPDYANAYFELGNALLKKGDIAGAVTNLETAAKLQPGEAHVHYQLGRAYIAAGRQAEGEGQLEVARQIKEKALRQTNP